MFVDCSVDRWMGSLVSVSSPLAKLGLLRIFKGTSLRRCTRMIPLLSLKYNSRCYSTLLFGFLSNPPVLLFVYYVSVMSVLCRYYISIISVLCQYYTWSLIASIIPPREGHTPGQVSVL